MEEGVQTYLRSVDAQVHKQLSDLEDEERSRQYDRFVNDLRLDPTVEGAFLAAISEEEDDYEIDDAEAAVILNAIQSGPNMSMQAYLSSIYCCQTFPMDVALQERC